MYRSKKGQLSAEMLILLAVILAVAAIVALQLLNSAKTTSNVVSGQANATISAACSSNPVAGCPCKSDSDCASGYTCDAVSSTCTS